MANVRARNLCRHPTYWPNVSRQVLASTKPLYVAYNNRTTQLEQGLHERDAHSM